MRCYARSLSKFELIIVNEFEELDTGNTKNQRDFVEKHSLAINIRKKINGLLYKSFSSDNIRIKHAEQNKQ